MSQFKNILKSVGLGLSVLMAQVLSVASVSAAMVNGVYVPENAPTGGLDGTFNTLFSIARTIVSGITGILAIVMVAIFTWKAFQFARTGDNPSERVKNINGMIFFFIGAACFGAASLITGVFSGMLVGI